MFGKKILVSILLFFSFCSVSFAKNVKFVQVSDVHFSKDNARYLSEFVNDINTDFSDVDFVVFTGDNLSKPDAGYLWSFLDIIKKLKPKTYVLAGDRDLFDGKSVNKTNYFHLVKKRLGFYHSSKPNYTFKKGNILFIVMDGVKEYIPSYNGYYQQDELAWLDKTLKRNKNKKVVILQHFPLIDSDNETINLYRKQDYLDILSKHDNVLAIISGHYHQNREIVEGGIHHIITQKFGNNDCYKVIEIDEKDYFIYTSLIDNSH